MKKKLHFLLLFILLPISLLGQGLIVEAQYLKSEKQDMFNAIKEYAVNKWDEDHDMIVYKINEQSKAFMNVMQSASGSDLETQKILLSAIDKWSKKKTKDFAKNSTIDWKMVDYEMKKQTRAKKAYSSVAEQPGYKGLDELLLEVRLHDQVFYKALEEYAKREHGQNKETIVQEMNSQFKAFREALDLINRYSNRGISLFSEYAVENYGTKELKALMANNNVDWQKFTDTLKNELEPPMPKLKPRN